MTLHSELGGLLAAEASPAYPRISNAQLLNAPENQAIKDIWIKPYVSSRFAGKSAAVVATDGVEEIEITTIVHALRSQGVNVDIVSPRKPQPPEWYGLQMPVIRETHILTIRFIEPGGWLKIDKYLDEVKAADYDAVIVPGGTWNPDILRADQDALNLIKAFARTDKIVAAICHGPWVLSDAGVMRGKNGTSWWSMRADLENAGVTFIDEPVVVDGNLITSRSPMDLAHFINAVENKLGAR